MTNSSELYRDLPAHNPPGPSYSSSSSFCLFSFGAFLIYKRTFNNGGGGACSNSEYAMIRLPLTIVSLIQLTPETQPEQHKISIKATKRDAIDKPPCPSHM